MSRCGESHLRVGKNRTKSHSPTLLILPNKVPMLPKQGLLVVEGREIGLCRVMW